MAPFCLVVYVDCSLYFEIGQARFCVVSVGREQGVFRNLCDSIDVDSVGLAGSHVWREYITLPVFR